jgi:hypothetical protein
MSDGHNSQPAPFPNTIREDLYTPCFYAIDSYVGISSVQASSRFLFLLHIHVHEWPIDPLVCRADIAQASAAEQAHVIVFDCPHEDEVYALFCFVLVSIPCLFFDKK